MIRPSARCVYERAVQLDADFDHAAAAGAVEHHVVQRGGRIQLLFAAPGAALEQHAFLDLEAAFQHARQRGLRVLQRDVGDEAQPPMVDADQRHAEGRQVARRAQHGAVAAHDHRQRGVLADLFERGGGNSVSPVLRAVSASTSSCRPACLRERERPQRCVQAGVLVSADQGDGGKVHGCERIRKGDAGKRDTCPEWASLPIIWGRIRLRDKNRLNWKRFPKIPAMDDRARALLKALIERYIADGQPWVRGRYPKSSIFPRPRSATSCRTSKSWA